MGGNDDKIQYQTDKINAQIGKTSTNKSTYQARTNYQMQMYHSVKYVNQILLSIFIVGFVTVKVLMIVQYIQGVKRNETQDFIWLCVFFFYPYLIYYIEKMIYFGITYVLSFLYGESYVYKFDQILMMTDFYKDPGEEGTEWMAGSVPGDGSNQPDSSTNQ